MEVQELFRIILGQGGVAALLLVILWSGVRKHWVFGWYAKEVTQDRDEWKAAALNGTIVAKQAVETLERTQDGTS